MDCVQHNGGTQQIMSNINWNTMDNVHHKGGTQWIMSNITVEQKSATTTDLQE